LIYLQDILKKFGDVYREKGGVWVQLTEEYAKGFDLDLKFGKLGEDFVRDMQLGNEKIEVKTERDIWKTTGNIAIEIRYKGQPSGLSTTESNVWVHLLSYKGVIEGGFLFKVDLLKEKIKKLFNDGEVKMTMGGDDNLSQMVLLPIKELFSKK
tara:strand:+ start:5907 stop:6365 length:459 start_codon:yes stop_codon:yes gene_type:complete